MSDGRWLERVIFGLLLSAAASWTWRVSDRATRTELALAELSARVDGRVDLLNERIGYTNLTLARIEQALKEKLP